MILNHVGTAYMAIDKQKGGFTVISVSATQTKYIFRKRE